MTMWIPRGKKLVRRKKKDSSPDPVYVSGMDIEGLPPYEIYEPIDYKDGPEGFIKWCEDFVCIPIYPEGNDVASWCAIGDLPKDINPQSGKSYDHIWEMQKGEFRKALRMKDGRFIYRLVVFCWPRGEGKSLAACLIQLWKFFNWTKQQIVLGANSKEQITFVHYDIMRDIILNSPKLLRITGKKNIQEKKIKILDEQGREVSVIRAISSFSGIVSNITGYTFSEIFDMKNPKFFVQLDGSIRNIPNALGVIDSTVSSKQHILYNLYKSYVDRKSKTTFFSYRFSAKGRVEDYWNPNMTQAQLDDYREKFPLIEYERYFLNTWSSGAQKVITEAMIEATEYIGANGQIGNSKDVLMLCQRKQELKEHMDNLITSGLRAMDFLQETKEIATINSKFFQVSAFYSLHEGGIPRKARFDELNTLGDRLDTNWAILCGLDRADPMKTGKASGARTMFTCMAKGLAGSKSRPFLFSDVTHEQSYVYFILCLADITSHSLEDIKAIILSCNEEYDGIDAFCGERWGIWDLDPWCKEKEIKLEVVYPTYDRQRAAFTELYTAFAQGRIKTPPVLVAGSKEPNIFKEEAGILYHDADKHWFGSPEKNEKYGIQDDCMYSVAWTMYGGREIRATDFKERTRKMWWGDFVPTGLRMLGRY